MVLIVLVVCKYDCNLHAATGTPYNTEVSSELHYVPGT